MRLTKSKFCAGISCPKKLYFSVHHPELAAAPDPLTQLRFDQGNQVGEFARKMFPQGVLVREDHTELNQALRTTTKLVQDSKVSSIFEGTFIYQDVLVRVDILVRNTDPAGTWDLIEVKSTTEVKEEHTDDVAIQFWVLEQCGIKIRKAFLRYVNNQAVSPDWSHYFIDHELTETVKQKSAFVEENVRRQIEVLQAKAPPEVDIGLQCLKPHACDFEKQCWSEVPRGSILELYRMKKEKRFMLYHSLGSQNLIEHLDEDEMEFTAFQKRQWIASRQTEPVFERKAIKKILSKLSYPLYFLDFETIGPVIPLIEGTRPYQPIPVQYYCYILREPNGKVEHDEFLASGVGDPRKECAQALVKLFEGSSGTIVAYNDSFEKAVVKGLAAVYVEGAATLLSLIPRFWDLEDIFQNHFYHQDFEGSVSIKNVLPYFAPELNYSKLAIKDGGAAQAALTKLLCQPIEPSEAAQLRKNLTEYCAQDSMAMLVIYQKLLDFIGS